MDILFWSGGKDSFLALQFYRENNPEQPLKLLTTYDGNEKRIPQQKLAIDVVTKQAEFLGLEIICVPLPPSCPNAIYLKKIEEALNNQAESIGNLLFGDWGLQDIRVWREKQFNNRGYSCRFPIWHKNMDQLLQILAQEPVHVHISAVAEKYKNVIKIGELYDEQFIKHLPDRINPMGEKGEFHTEVRFRI